jgi:hydrogenase maturation factor HypF (carbamoyltransferase family)
MKDGELTEEEHAYILPLVIRLQGDVSYGGRFLKSRVEVSFGMSEAFLNEFGDNKPTIERITRIVHDELESAMRSVDKKMVSMKAVEVDE